MNMQTIFADPHLGHNINNPKLQGQTSLLNTSSNKEYLK